MSIGFGLQDNCIIGLRLLEFESWRLGLLEYVIVGCGSLLLDLDSRSMLLLDAEYWIRGLTYYCGCIMIIGLRFYDYCILGLLCVDSDSCICGFVYYWIWIIISTRGFGLQDHVITGFVSLDSDSCIRGLCYYASWISTRGVGFLDYVIIG